jgi:hypothetical protein
MHYFYLHVQGMHIINPNVLNPAGEMVVSLIIVHCTDHRDEIYHQWQTDIDNGNDGEESVC